MSSSESHSHCHCGCCASMDRREFMTAVGASALAINIAATALGAVSTSAPTSRKPRPWRSVKLRPSHRELGWESDNVNHKSGGINDDEDDGHSGELP